MKIGTQQYQRKWVDETHPRYRRVKLTAWESGQYGVPYMLIPDNSGGSLMQQKMVDIVIAGSDRTTRTGKGTCRAREKDIKEMFSDKFN